jgi:hypothetical protein
MRRIKSTVAALAVAAAMAASAGANAAPIEGTIGFTGVWQPTAGGSVVGIPAAEVVDIIGNTATVIDGSQGGDFVGLMGSTFFADIDFATPGTPIDPLWGPFAGFRFTLDSVSVVTQTASVLGLTGDGTMFGDGLDPTPFQWDFSGQQTGSTLTFSTTTAEIPNGTAVPVPATLSLLGAGLIGLGLLARRRGA